MEHFSGGNKSIINNVEKPIFGRFFWIGLPDCVRYNEGFVILRFVI